MLVETLRVLGSNLAVNLSSFLVLALAGRAMPVDQFAQLSLIVAMSQLGSSALELGINVGTVKKYAEKKEPRFLSTLIWLKMTVYSACMLFAFLGFACGLPTYWLVVIVSAASIDLWSGARALEQAKMDFGSFAQANLLFAVLRVPLALFGVATGNALVVAVGLYIAPLLAIALYKWRKTADHVEKLAAGTVEEILSYARPVYVSATLFTISIYFPQFLISHRLDAAAVSTFGILLVFFGPLVLVNTSLRIYLLPLVAGSALKRSDLISNPRFPLMVSVILAAAVLGLAGSSVAIETIYGAKYPGIWLPFAVFLGLNFLWLLIGQFNVEIHRLGRVRIEAIINAFRLAALVMLLWLFGTDLLSIVILSGLTMLAGEVVLFIVIGELSRREMDVQSSRAAVEQA